MQLRIQQKKIDNILILNLWGQLDAVTADLFNATIKTNVDDSIQYVILNFCNLEMVDSTGIGAMVALLKRMRREGGDTVTVEVAEQPLEVFKILNLDKSIKMFTSLNDALSFCNAQTSPHPSSASN